jgi:Fe2+ transport system protein FeoA
MKLSELKVGEMGKIISIENNGVLKRRMMDMGVLPGELIVIEKIAPLGDPIDVKIKGYQLSFRKNEASLINVKKI